MPDNEVKGSGLTSNPHRANLVFLAGKELEAAQGLFRKELGQVS